MGSSPSSDAQVRVLNVQNSSSDKLGQDSSSKQKAKAQTTVVAQIGLVPDQQNSSSQQPLLAKSNSKIKLPPLLKRSDSITMSKTVPVPEQNQANKKQSNDLTVDEIDEKQNAPQEGSKKKIATQGAENAGQGKQALGSFRKQKKFRPSRQSLLKLNGVPPQ